MSQLFSWPWCTKPFTQSPPCPFMLETSLQLSMSCSGTVLFPGYESFILQQSLPYTHSPNNLKKRSCLQIHMSVLQRYVKGAAMQENLSLLQFSAWNSTLHSHILSFCYPAPSLRYCCYDFILICLGLCFTFISCILRIPII